MLSHNSEKSYSSYNPSYNYSLTSILDPNHAEFLALGYAPLMLHPFHHLPRELLNLVLHFTVYKRVLKCDVILREQIPVHF